MHYCVLAAGYIAANCLLTTDLVLLSLPAPAQDRLQVRYAKLPAAEPGPCNV